MASTGAERQITFVLDLPKDLVPGEYMFHVSLKIHVDPVASMTSTLNESTTRLDDSPTQSDLPTTPKLCHKRQLEFNSSPIEASDASPYRNIRIRYKEEESTSEAEWAPPDDVTLVDLVLPKHISKTPTPGESYSIPSPSNQPSPPRSNITELQEAYYRAIEAGEMVPDSQGEDLEDLGIPIDPAEWNSPRETHKLRLLYYSDDDKWTDDQLHAFLSN